MNSFKSLFGINKAQVRKTCILMPVVSKPFLRYFKIGKLKKGFPYSAYSTSEFTIIHTLIGTAFLGDCVMGLKGSPGKNIILFGSCGAVQEKNELKIGALAVPKKCFEMESFSQMLKGINKAAISKPDKDLLEKFKNINKVTCATVGSIKLEKTYKKYFISKNIDIVDMECSAFFNAAKSINKKAAALFYITDNISDNGPFAKKTSSEIKDIEKTQINGAETIRNLLSLVN